MTVQMENNAASFLGGFSLSVLANWQWIFAQIHIDPSDLAMSFAIKVLATLILGVIGGVAGLLGKDLYTGFKKKLNDKENDGTV